METVLNTIVQSSKNVDKTKMTSIFTIIGSVLTLIVNILSKLF